MEFEELIRQRRSCRQFADRPVAPEVLSELLARADMAPAAGNRRADRQLIAVTDRGQLMQMAQQVRLAWARLLAASPNAGVAGMADYGQNFDHFGSAPAAVFLAGRRPPDFLSAALGELAAERFLGNGASVQQSAMLFMLAAEHSGLGCCMMTGPLVAETELLRELKLSPRWILYGLIVIGYKR